MIPSTIDAPSPVSMPVWIRRRRTGRERLGVDGAHRAVDVAVHRRSTRQRSTASRCGTGTRGRPRDPGTSLPDTPAPTWSATYRGTQRIRRGAGTPYSRCRWRSSWSGTESPSGSATGSTSVNPPLTDRGHLQAAAMGEVLAAESFDEVLVSPLDPGPPDRSAVARRVRSRRGGRRRGWRRSVTRCWHGTPAEKAAEAYERDAWPRRSTSVGAGLEGGESMRDFIARIRTGRRGSGPSVASCAPTSISRSGRSTSRGADRVDRARRDQLGGDRPPPRPRSRHPWEWDRFVLGHTSISRIEAIRVHDGYTSASSKLSDVEHLASRPTR